jgi:hypothetical protein
VVEVVPDLVDLGHRDAALRGQVEQRRGEVLAVLPASGVARVSTREDHADPAAARLGRLAQGVDQVGVPVPVAPVQRQAEAAGVELGPQRGEQGPVLVVDRAAAAEVEVVLGHGLEPLGRDAPAPGDVLEEGHHVVGLLGAAEGQQQDRVVGVGGGRVLRCEVLVGHPGILTGAAGHRAAVPRPPAPPTPTGAAVEA